MYYSIHSPNRFIQNHLDCLLPAWFSPVRSVLVVLQRCNCSLLDKTPASDRQKQLLRQQFLAFGDQVVQRLQRDGFLAELFDPCTGLPLHSPAGRFCLDDVAVASACLGYGKLQHNGCRVMVHPVWGSSVYPSTLLSSALPEEMEQIMREVQATPTPLQPVPHHLWESGAGDRYATSPAQVGGGSPSKG
jgi:hypothetical protein